MVLIPINSLILDADWSLGVRHATVLTIERLDLIADAIIGITCSFTSHGRAGEDFVTPG